MSDDPGRPNDNKSKSQETLGAALPYGFEYCPQDCCEFRVAGRNASARSWAWNGCAYTVSDRESVTYLLNNYPFLPIIEGDFLKLDLSQHFSTPFCVVGNFPYNISSQIFFKALEYKDQIPCVVGMIQKEVAERLAEPPGSKVYGILSVLIQTYYDIEYLFTVNENVFYPPPKVKSAVIRLTRNKRESLSCDDKLFVSVVKTAFNQRRKQMRNSLKAIIGKDNPFNSSPILDERPERLSVDEFIDLTNQIAESLLDAE
jgi:16S rRNA (adenine1518-N6/adenine1519-N6)-dimethyltransferase